MANKTIFFKLSDKPGKGNSTQEGSINYNLSEDSKKSKTEFGIASSAGRLIRTGIEPIIKNIARDKLNTRLNSKLTEVITCGPATLKGRRQVTDGDLALLRGLS